VILVNKPAKWVVNITYLSSVFFSSITFSRTRWQSFFMHLVVSWNTKLDAIWLAGWLSQYNCIRKDDVLPSFWSCCIHTSSQAILAIPWNLDFALDLDTTLCLLPIVDDSKIWGVNTKLAKIWGVDIETLKRIWILINLTMHKLRLPSWFVVESILVASPSSPPLVLKSWWYIPTHARWLNESLGSCSGDNGKDDTTLVGMR